jgi:hypothetical protein
MKGKPLPKVTSYRATIAGVSADGAIVINVNGRGSDERQRRTDARRQLRRYCRSLTITLDRLEPHHATAQQRLGRLALEAGDRP